MVPLRPDPDDDPADLDWRDGAPFLVAAVVFLLLLAALGRAWGEQRIDFFKPDGSRAGYAIIDDRGRVQTFDAQSRRTGSAVLNPTTGRLDFYDVQSRRTGSGTITTPSTSTPKR